MRILSDLTQPKLRPQHPGRSAYLMRQRQSERPDVSDGSRELSSNSSIATLGQSEALARVSASSRPGQRPGVERAPRRFYAPLDEHPALPRFAIIDRASDTVQAFVRGSLEHVQDEAQLLASSHGLRLRDFRIVIASH